MKVIGSLTPDFYGKILKTGYNRFHSSTGIAGLCKINGSRVDILAVHSDNPGTGQFKRFIKKLKKEADGIVLRHVDNPMLKDALARYGFNPVMDVESIDGRVEFVPGMEWTSKPKRPLGKHQS